MEHMVIMLLLNPDENEKSMRGVVGHGISAHGFDSRAQEECLEAVREALLYVEKSLEKARDVLLKNLSEVDVEWAYKNAIWPDI